MSALNAFDWLLLGLAGVLAVAGLIKGMTRILVGIAALCAAFVVAARLHPLLAERLGWLGWPADVRRFVAYLAIFAGVVLVGALLARLMRGMVKAALLGWADRLGGAALGLVAATLLSALLILPLVAYVPAGPRVLQGSTLAPYVSVVADLANHVAPVELSRRYRERMDDLKLYWRERWVPA